MRSTLTETHLNECSTLASFKIQCRVVWALLMREIITKHGRHNIGFLWMIAEPMLFTLGVTVLWSFRGVSEGPSISITVFALTGYSCVLLWRTMPGRAESALKMNLPLLHHRNVRPLDIYIARLSLEAIGVIMCFFALATIYTWFELLKPPEDILKVFLGLFMLSWFGFALALNIGCLSERFHWIDKIWHPCTYLLMPISGSGFLVQSLPDKYQSIYLKIPTVHAVECVRDGYFGSMFKAKYDLWYLAIWNILLLICGLYQVRIITKHINK